MKSYRPDRNALLTLRILTLAASLILFTAARIYVPVDIVVVIIALALVTADIFVMFVYLPLYFSSLSYDSTDSEITRHGGVFFKTHQSVKYSTVQYTTVVTTPFSQYTGLNFVIFFVYGGQLRLMFLSQTDAIELLRHTDYEEGM